MNMSSDLVHFPPPHRCTRVENSRGNVRNVFFPKILGRGVHEVVKNSKGGSLFLVVTFLIFSFLKIFLRFYTPSPFLTPLSCAPMHLPLPMVTCQVHFCWQTKVFLFVCLFVCLFVDIQSCFVYILIFDTRWRGLAAKKWKWRETQNTGPSINEVKMR